MTIREQINNRPWISYTIIVLLIALAVGIALHTRSQSRPTIVISSKSFFTADDGKTTFVESATRQPPFRLPDGREAVLAHVFTHDGTDRFVAFLERDDGAGSANTPHQMNGSFVPGPLASRMVKRPGDSSWFPMTSEEGMKIMNVRGPDGELATQVESDSE